MVLKDTFNVNIETDAILRHPHDTKRNIMKKVTRLERACFGQMLKTCANSGNGFDIIID